RGGASVRVERNADWRFMAERNELPVHVWAEQRGGPVIHRQAADAPEGHPCPRLDDLASVIQHLEVPGEVVAVRRALARADLQRSLKRPAKDDLFDADGDDPPVRDRDLDAVEGGVPR